jgi:negative elongation factor C/D
VGAKRITEELLRVAPEKSSEAIRWSMHLGPAAAYPRVFSALGSMLSRDTASPGDIAILHKEYSSNDPPPVELLQTPAVFNLLVDYLFKLKQVVRPEHRLKYVYLLAYAASVYEKWENGYRTGIYRDEFHATQLALDRTQFTLSKATHSKLDMLPDLMHLYDNMKYPIVCLSVVCWCEANAMNASLFSVATDSVPLQLALLDEVCSQHRLLHERVRYLLFQLLEENFPNMDVHQQLKLRRTVMDRVVHLFLCGHVHPVLSYIHQSLSSQSLDLSLIRHFVSEVLEIIKEPFSDDIKSLLLPIIEDEDLVEPLKASQQTSQSLTRFLSNTRDFCWSLSWQLKYVAVCV